jgi:hypothetical protein
MANLTSHTPRSNLHPLDRCAFCGARAGLYTRYLVTTRCQAVMCDDPIKCLRRKGQRGR